MGARGPKPKNPALKILAGNPGRRPVAGGRTRGRAIAKGIPDRPPELTGEAAAEWDRLAPELDACGILAATDRGILSAYCLAVADMLAARAAVMEFGRWVSQPVQNARGEVLGSKWVEHPAVKLLADASRRIERFGAALMLNPAARDRREGAGEPAAPEGNKVVAIRDRFQSAT
jgi:P27 family predicted phage terminase small subunit